MKKKNILISVAVLGTGIILYKLLLGLVLPIALFVSLGYVLKFLLKDIEAEPIQGVSRIFNEDDTSSLIDKVVEIEPIEEDKPSKEDKPTEEEDKPTEEDKPIKDDKPIEEIKNKII